MFKVTTRFMGLMGLLLLVFMLGLLPLAFVQAQPTDNLPTPTDLTASQESQAPFQIRLNWMYSDTSTIDGFEIVDQPNSANEFVIAQVGPTESSYLDTYKQITCGSTYTYGVRAYQGNQKSEYATISITTTACPSAALAISKSGPSSAEAGDEVEYTLTVTNTGSTTAINLVVYDKLPANSTFVSADNGGRLDAGDVQWQLGFLEAQQSRTVQVSVSAQQDIVNQSYGAFAKTIAGEQVSVQGTDSITTQIGDETPSVEVCALNVDAATERFMPPSSNGFAVPQTTEVVTTGETTLPRRASASKSSDDAFLLQRAAEAQALANRYEVIHSHQQPLQEARMRFETELAFAQSKMERNRDPLISKAGLTGTLTGTVMTDFGDIVPHARIEARNQHGKKASTVSDATGQFVLSDLSMKSEWQVNALPPLTGAYVNHLPSSHAYVDFAVVGTDYMLPEPLFLYTPYQLDASARGEGELNGVVQTDEGLPVEGAQLFTFRYSSTEAGQFTRVVSNQQGEFSLRGLDETASWNILAVAPLTGPYTGYLDSGSNFSVELYLYPSPYDLPEPLVISRPNLTGRFVLEEDLSDSGLQNAIVFIDTLDADGQIDLAAPSWRVATSAHFPDFGLIGGSFTAGTLPAGRDYQVSLFELPSQYEEWTLPAPVLFAITDNVSIKELGDIQVPKTIKRIVGQVTFEEGQGVQNVRVEANRVDGEDGFAFTFTDEDGDYVLPVEDGDWGIKPGLPRRSGNNWIFTGQPKIVEFQEAYPGPEEANVDFNVTEAELFLTGQVVRPDGNPLAGSTFRDDASIDVWDTINQRFYYIYLAADGFFKVPVLPGYHEIALWLRDEDHPESAGEAITARNIQAADGDAQGHISLNTIQLIQRVGTVSGQLTDNEGNGVRDVDVDVWEPGGRWFTAQSDSSGSYSIKVPPGEWEVGPYLGPNATYVAEAGTQFINVSSSNRQAEANFELTQATQRIDGRFVDEAGNVIDVDATVYLTRPGTRRRIAIGPVTRGQFYLPLPDDCYDENNNLICEVGFDLAENASQSTISDMLTIQNRQPNGDTTVVFRMQENNAMLSGNLIDPQTGTPVTGLNGIVSLIPAGNHTASQSVQIGLDGSYRFAKVGAGHFSLSYQLELEAEQALVQGLYRPTPIFPFTIIITKNEQLTRDIVLERDETFDVTVTSPEDGQPTNDYPTSVICEYVPADSLRDFGTLRVNGSLAQGGGGGGGRGGHQRTTCVFIPGPPPRRICTPSGGGRLSLAALLTTRQPNTLLFNEFTPQNCQIQFGDTPLNPNGETAQRAGEPRRAITEKNPSPQSFNVGAGDITVAARTRNIYLVGQVFDKSGTLIRDGTVDVTAYSDKNDGQVERVQTDANGCYRLHVAQSDTNWSLQAKGERNGFNIAASASITEPIPNAQGIIFGPPLQLASTGQAVVRAANHTFNAAEGTSYEFIIEEANNRDPFDRERTVRISIPPGAIPSELGQVKLFISPIEAPNTSFEQVIGDAVNIQFIEETTGREIAVELRQRMSVELPYDSAELAQLGLTIDDLRVARFSYETNSWITVPRFRVDSENEVIKLKLWQGVDAIAIIAPDAPDGLVELLRYYFPFMFHE